MGMFSRFSNHIDRQAGLMGRMMERLDVDTLSIGREPVGIQLERAIRSCIFCSHGAECQEWLATQSDEPVQDGPSFCPNKAYFAQHRGR